MNPYFQDSALTIYHGDALEALKTLPDGSVNCCVTSPPYWGLRDYGIPGQIGLEKTPEEYVSKMVEIFREVRRVLLEDGTLWLNLGDCFATGAGRVGNCPGGGDQGNRWRDPTLKGYRGTRAGDPKNVYAMGPLVQPNRMPLEGLKPKDMVGIPWRVAFALQAAGWWLRRDIIWHKPNPMPESVKDRPTTAHEYIFLMSKAERYYYDYEAVKEPAVYGVPNSPESIKSPHGQGFTRRAACCSFKSPVDENGKPGQPKQHRTDREDKEYAGTRNIRSVWTVPTAPYKGPHYETFPPNLIIPCILAGCPRGGTVLDPFAGTGVTGMVAERFERKAILIDISDKDLKLMKQRNGQRRLFMGGEYGSGGGAVMNPGRFAGR